MSALNKYLLNGVDVFTAFGLVIISGSDSFLKPRKRKEPYSYDWPEQNGKEWDLDSVPKFEDRVFKLQAAIIADSEASFWTKFDALNAALYTSGTKSITVVEFGKAYNVFCREIGNVERLTRIKEVNQIGVRFDIELQEVQL